VEIARSMVSEFGMSPLGPIYVGDDLQSQHLLDRVEEAVNSIINTQLERACKVVGSERESIGRLVERLLEQDTVEAAEIQQCFRPEPTVNLLPPTVHPPQPAMV
jgi:ATP-dependent Zn protease